MIPSNAAGSAGWARIRARASLAIAGQSRLNVSFSSVIFFERVLSSLFAAGSSSSKAFSRAVNRALEPRTVRQAAHPFQPE